MSEEDKKEVLSKAPTYIQDNGRFRDFQRELNEAYLHTKEKPKEKEMSEEEMFKMAAAGDGAMQQLFQDINAAKRDLSQRGLTTWPTTPLYEVGECVYCNQSVVFKKNFKSGELSDIALDSESKEHHVCSDTTYVLRQILNRLDKIENRK